MVRAQLLAHVHVTQKGEFFWITNDLGIDWFHGQRTEPTEADLINFIADMMAMAHK
jgi:hypothetical protein